MTFHPPLPNRLAHEYRLSEVESLAQPLLESLAFRRLDRLTFLGILSPRFANQVNSPLWESGCYATVDGSRMHHSLGVAAIALELAQRLDFSSSAVRYAVAWGLTHDIATWPLSHTGETAFRSITRTSPHEVREAMLLGSEKAPHYYRLDRVLRMMAVDPEVLLNLFQKDDSPANGELELLKQIIHSPLTPDTLEGSWRAGIAFGVPVPSPNVILPCFMKERGNICLHRNLLSTVVDFWNRKAEMYHQYINRPEIILWESAWTLAIKRECEEWILSRTLDVHEDFLVSRILAIGLPKSSHVVRYKRPQEYLVSGNLEMLHAEPRVNELWNVLERKPMEVPSHD